MFPHDCSGVRNTPRIVINIRVASILGTSMDAVYLDGPNACPSSHNLGARTGARAPLIYIF